MAEGVDDLMATAASLAAEAKASGRHALLDVSYEVGRRVAWLRTKASEAKYHVRDATTAASRALVKPLPRLRVAAGAPVVVLGETYATHAEGAGGSAADTAGHRGQSLPVFCIPFSQGGGAR